MIYRFSGCEVDTKLLELRRDGQARALDPLEFDLLLYLIENNDRVVTRDELFDALWPGRIVTDSALSSRLKAIRKGVGDTGKAQKVIKTAHGRGYRFVADLGPSEESETARRDESGTAVSPVASAVGRDAELGKLRRWLDRSISGQRNIVLISGEAGVGKTTLVRAFLDSNKGRDGMLLMHGQCVNQRGASEAYLPLLEAFARAGHDDRAIIDLLRRHAPAWLLQLPSLHHASMTELEQASVGTTTGRMLREICDALEFIARDRPTVIIIEDLHWADPSTIEWLDYFAHRSKEARLMVIVTGRPHGPHQSLCRGLALRRMVQNLKLESIEEASVADYLTHRLGLPPEPQLAALTFRRTRGFPLFIEALLTHWLENGLIERGRDRWAPALDEAALLEGVPADLIRLIERQLEGLGQEEKVLLETAALAGSTFAASAVAYALDRGEEAVEALCGRLARQNRIIRNAGEEAWPDGTVTATFEFRHELYRETLYEAVPASRRARLHGALGERLEMAYGEQSVIRAHELADHFARARMAERALKYFYPAALKAFNRSAHREAQAILNRALETLATLPESDDHLRIERQLHLLRASTCISLQGWAAEDVETSYRRARSIALRLGLDEKSVETLGLASMEELRGHYRKSEGVLQSLLDDTSMLGLEAHELLACSLFHQGKFKQSMDSADRAVSQYDPKEISSVLARYGENPGVCCHGWAALDLWFLGYPEAAIERSDQALTLAREHVYSHSTALTHRTFLHQFRNEPERTLACARKTREIAQRQGFDFRIAQTAIIGAWARARLADGPQEREDALGQLDTGIRDYTAMGAEMDLPYYLTLRADVLHRSARVEEALALQDEALAMTADGRDFFFEAEMHRLRALWLLAQARPDRSAAEAALDISLQRARQQGARTLELRTRTTRLELLGPDAGGGQEQAELVSLMARLGKDGDAPDWLAANRFC
jgi:DNA-binding winged helix-turn-helix (wHTH) protein/type II secretory pathway predicted ATPase ExeA/tetratricopeptide (TPR) repeat protein